MQSQQPKPAKAPLSVQNSLLAILPIAALAGVSFWFVVNKLLETTLERHVQNTDPVGFLVAIFMTATALPLIIGAGIFISSVLAWLVMRLLGVEKAGLIVFSSAVVLSVGSWFYFYRSGSHLPWNALLAAIVFVVVFEVWALIILTPRNK